MIQQTERNRKIAIDYISGKGSLRVIGEKYGLSYSRVAGIVTREVRYIKHYGSYIVNHPVGMKQIMAKKDILLKILTRSL